MAVQKLVLFICVENAARSLMAEAMFNRSPPVGWTATSAGTSPGRAPNPRTQPMLREIGLELPLHPPRLLSDREMQEASIRVTMGCLDDAACPARLKTLELRDWGLPDPTKLDDDGFRQVRDDLVVRVRGLATEIASLQRRHLTQAGSPPT